VSVVRLRRVAAAAVLAVALGVAACGEEVPPPPSGPAPHTAAQVPYDPAFAFKQQIGADPALDARSAAIVARLAENRTRSAVFLADRTDVPPVYVAKKGDPVLSIDIDGTAHRFRVPAGARPGDGVDAPMVVLDPDHPEYGRATELRLYRAQVDREGGRLLAEGAGLFHYNNDGDALNPDGSRSLAEPFAGAGTGSGLSIMAGLIRPAEVRNGEIRHALRFAYSAPDFSDRYRPPATGTDQPNDTVTRDPASAMDMGMRLQLDPTVDCDTRTVPGKADRSRETRFLRMICRALQRYGMIAVDGTSEDGLVLMMEHDATAGWEELVGEERFGGYGWLVRDVSVEGDNTDRDETSGVPWDRLRVLKSSIPRPISARTTSTGPSRTR
jgi:hypothetical protein